MTYLIDGYNLMHAVGLMNRRLPAKQLNRARTRLLDWLADHRRDRPVVLQVVFDAQNGSAPSSEYGYRGIRVRFAYRRTADEEIDDLISGTPQPRQLTVVSNDAQVQAAGRHRRCAVLTCQEFVDWMIARTSAQRPPSGSTDDEKPEQTATPEEMDAWLAAFSKPPQKRR